MADNKKRKKKRAARSANTILRVLIALLILSTGVLIWLCVNITSMNTSRPQASTAPTASPTEMTTEPEPTETDPPETEPPEPEHVVATATIGATGDILMHLPVVNTGLQGDGTYNFDSIFQFLNTYSSGVDYAVANLETTLCGTDNGYKYSGYPQFNCPDEIIDGAKDAGFDMMLTANNHCYDTRRVGLLRTIGVIQDRGLEVLGTYEDPEAPKYSIVEINGIKIGMLCYTYETPVPENGYSGRAYLNGLLIDREDEQRIASFLPSNPTPFYNEIQGYLDEMKEQGVEATVMFIHWGEEYLLNPIPYQKTMAQKLCDMGFDVIVGGHPHVVEPVELLTSTEDPDHKTVCLYSMGNAVSNQRYGNISRISTAHTEDGVWFTFTFSKYSDDTVYLESVDLIPTWVNLVTDGRREYRILPLDYSLVDDWKELFSLSDTSFGAAQKSYDRTMALVGEGIDASNAYLQEAKEQREADYLAAIVELLYAA